MGKEMTAMDAKSTPDFCLKSLSLILFTQINSKYLQLNLKYIQIKKLNMRRRNSTKRA